MELQKSFPPELLAASDDERSSYFQLVRVNHPHRAKYLEQLDELASGSVDQRMILLLGGAGTGKTDLLHAAVDLRTEQRREKMAADSQIVPAIYVELEEPVKGSFDLTPFYREALVELQAALVDRTLNSIQRALASKIVSSPQIERAHTPSSETLKNRFRDNAIRRELELACIDEAICAFKVAESKKPQDRIEKLTHQANRIKSLVNKSSTTYVLAGAYDFYDLSVGTAQLARRCRIVHVLPYGSSEKELVGFVTALVGFLSHLPIDHDISPTTHSTELYLHCLGCIGILKDFFISALRRALKRKTRLTMLIVRECYFPAFAMEKMQRELDQGIKALSTFMSMERLANSREMHVKFEDAVRAPALEPGETKPSHRRDATEWWGN